MTQPLMPPNFYKHKDLEPYFASSSSLGGLVREAIDLGTFEHLLWLVYRHQPRAVQITKDSESISDSERKNLDIIKALPSLLERGYSVVLNYAEEFEPKLAKISRGLTCEIGCPAHFAVFLSSVQARAFKPHRDAVDIAAVQIYGRKCWELETGEQALLKDPLLFEENETFHKNCQYILTPGDLLYIPRGLPHAVKTCDVPLSLHASIAFDATTGGDVLRAVIVEREARNLSLRRSVPLKFDFDQSAVSLPSKRETERAIQKIRAKEFQRLPQLPGQIELRVTEYEPKAEDRFIKAPGMPIEVILDGGEGVARVFFPGLKPPNSTVNDSGVVFSAHFVGILEFIKCTNSSFGISDFGRNVPDHVALHIIRTLVNEGLLLRCG